MKYLFETGFFQDENGPRLGHRLQDFMVPFFPLVQNREGFEYATNLGYEYEHVGVKPPTVDEYLKNFVQTEGSAQMDAFTPVFQNNTGNIFGHGYNNQNNRSIFFLRSVGWRRVSRPFFNDVRKKTKRRNLHHLWHRPRYSEGGRENENYRTRAGSKLNSVKIEKTEMQNSGKNMVIKFH